MGSRPHRGDRHGRAPVPARRGRCGHAVGGRGAARGALPAPPLQARHAPARRADQPPGRGERGLARALPQGLPGHGGGHHPRPLLPRQRRRLDSRARSRRGHPVGGQLLLVARSEEAAPRPGGEAGIRASAHPRARAGMGTHVAPSPPGQVQGASAGLRDPPRQRRRGARGFRRDRHSPWAPSGRRGRAGRASLQGLW